MKNSGVEDRSSRWPTPEIIDQRSYVDGQWCDMSESGGFLHDPNTGEIRQPKRDTFQSDVEKALVATRRFFESGSDGNIPLDLRVEIINAVADEVDRRQEEFAVQDSINMGAPIKTSRIIASALGNRVRACVEDAVQLGEFINLNRDPRPVRLLRKPIGPALIIAPWNAPTFTIVGKVASALLAGCPVILKPSENAPSGCQIFSEILIAEIESRCLDSAFFQLVHGDSAVGEKLTSDPRIEAISFTGGISAGRSVAIAAAMNLNVVQMELGSYNPAIVRSDADVAASAASLIQGMTRLNGQWCESPGKIFVHEDIYKPFIEAMRAELEKIRVGHALDADTQVGPIAFKAQLEMLKQEIARLIELGGTLVTAEPLSDLDGWFLAPGIIIGVPADQATSELFGPIATVHTYKDDAEALAGANAPQGGLDAFVFSSDIEAAMALGSKIRAGEVRINGTFMSDLADGSRQTFWGMSGIGGHGPKSGVRFFLGDRVVGLDRKDCLL